MDLSETVRRRLSIIVLVMGLVFLVAACQSEPAAAPTPTPEPELTLEELLASAGKKLAGMSTAKFQMLDEMETGAKFFRTTLKAVNGEIKSPDSVKMVVDVEAPRLGFAQIEILGVGEQVFMKFSKDAPWLPLPPEQIHFNFGGLGVTLSELLPVMKDGEIVGRESVGGVQTIRIEGNVLSEDLSDLITSVDPGHAITLTFWIDEDEHTLRQLRIAGQLFDEDAPETSRLVIMDINVPVDIQLPDVATMP